MLASTLQICFFISFLIMCPNKFFKNSVNGEVSQKFVKQALNQYMIQSLQATNSWAVDVLKDQSQGRVSMLDLTKPGFDYDEKEIIKFKIWPQGIIPYYIDEMSFDKVLRDRIRGFLDNVNTLTGLHFLELPGPPLNLTTRWVFFLNRRGLLNTDGLTTKDFTMQGVQKVVLGYDGVSTSGELCQAVLALAGVPPQHNSPDRNEYIDVQMENILPEKRQLFNSLKNDEWLFHDLAYDFSSAGHYSFHKYTSNGYATIKPLDSKYNTASVGEGNGFSYLDILKIRMLYNYILKKKAEMPECQKIFKPGPDFSKYKHIDDKIEPRPKPNKYLGLPDEAEMNKYSDHSEETEDSESDNNDEKKTVAASALINIDSNESVENKALVESQKEKPVKMSRPEKKVAPR